jgi:hypothetical protein
MELALVFGTALAFVVDLVLFAAGVVLFCRVIHRFSANARALGAERMLFDPKGAVGSFFIPLANCFLPYLMLTEIYTASDPQAGPDNWRQSPVRAPLGWWWLSWIACCFLSLVSFGMQCGTIQSTTYGAFVVYGLTLGATIAAGLLAIWVVRSIQLRQEAKAAMRLATRGRVE